tara:strand:+ start:387 stop:518 length:132 start_codon:yes stop_codon:yes gene_type:complete
MAFEFGFLGYAIHLIYLSLTTLEMEKPLVSNKFSSEFIEKING